MYGVHEKLRHTRRLIFVVIYFVRYAHYDASPSFSDFVSFGGWTKPAIKQYAGDVVSELLEKYRAGRISDSAPKEWVSHSPHVPEAVLVCVRA